MGIGNDTNLSRFFDGLKRVQVTERGRGSESGALIIYDLEDYGLLLVDEGGKYFVIGKEEDIGRLEGEMCRKIPLPSFGPPRTIPNYPPLINGTFPRDIRDRIL